MIDLFRYIEHDFAVPATTDAIDVANQSDFQTALGEAVGPGRDENPGPGERLRTIAEEYLSNTFASPTDDPARLGGRLSDLYDDLLALHPVTPASLSALVEHVFGRTTEQVVTDADFTGDRELLQNAVLALKLVTGFDRVDAARLVRQLRAAAFLEHLAGDDPAALTVASVAELLGRPARIPHALLAATAPSPRAPTAPPPIDVADLERVQSLRHERDRLQASYEALLAVPPEQLEVSLAEASPAEPRVADQGVNSAETDAVQSHESFVEPPRAASVVLGAAALEAFPADQVRAMSQLSIALAETPVATAVDLVGRRLAVLNDELLPIEVPAAAKVFQVGAHLFAETTAPMVTLADEVPAPLPDFSKAVTRPVGVGNLQVVRQELVGYRAGDISHIENVLEGELLRRVTTRDELSELTLTEETTSTQAQERDQQSTDRNELATETQKEAGHQSSTAGAGRSSTEYGRLVENSKTNFARSVSSRAVESVTQEVRTQRVQRERKRFVERGVHELDNKDGATKVRGIYQWVDKRYSLRVLNYGKRLMYDVVVPEPAAFLVDALKHSAQPESFQLTKPVDPDLSPAQVNPYNYAYYAWQYGVTGSVAPPPDVYTQTVAKAEAIKVTEHFTSYGVDVNPTFFGAFNLRVPEGYKAVSGYVQRLTTEFLAPEPSRYFEFMIGDRNQVLFGTGANDASRSFVMMGESGDVPVTFRTFARIISFSYAVAITCQRTDKAYEQWQLKTHATIMSGYQRQLAEYEDKLSRYVAAARARLAAAANYAHDPSVERQELKKAFTFLLLGEHPGAWPPTPVPAPAPPSLTLPDPVEVREWGAVVAFFERAFEWDNMMFTFYPYYWGRPERWEEMVLTQDTDPEFEAFLKAGAARVVVPVRPGFEAALAHFQETGDVWMGEEIPDMFGDNYVSIIAEIKAANFAPGDEVCVEQWEVTLPTTLVLLKDDATLPTWTPTPCNPPPTP